MSLLQIVRFDGLKSRDWFIYKYPMEDIVLGSQLIVQEGQTAVFVRGGTVADTFQPGTYTLSTDNLPLLRHLVNIPFGGRTPFSAELYFINHTAILDLHWGTTSPIQLIDPQYHVKLRIRAYGQMGLRILDPVLFFQHIIGGMQLGDIVKLDKLKEYYKGLLVHRISSEIASEIVTNRITALEIATKLGSLSEQIRDNIKPDFEQYGLSVVNFFIQSINFPDEDFARINAILEDRAAFELMGSERYATKRSFDVYEGAAKNPNGVAGALLAGGVGIGAGMETGASFANTINCGILTSKDRQTKECCSCHKLIAANARFCSYCGTEQTVRYCSCGAVIGSSARFCSSCGKKVE